MNNNGTAGCLECGKPIGPSVRYEKKFCAHACGTVYNNRRKQRGAELYDIFMAMRFDRANAKDKGAWAVMCRMASQWKAEDDAAGVRSFQPLNGVMEKLLRYVGVRNRVSR
jgi:predicted nucleic acid-binding Zn ribbon protein